MIRNRLIYLASSNARELYLRDVLSVVGSPKGQAVHFRYRNKWVDETLLSELPVGISGGGSALRNCRLVVLFLEQQCAEDDNRKNTWAALFPVRFATPVSCYKSGDSEEDYCHFFFSLDGFAEPRELPLECFDNKLFAAFLPPPLSRGEGKLEERAFDEGGFIRVTNFLSENKPASLGNRFKNLETGQSHVPIFVCVLGINRGMAFGRPQSIEPVHNNDVRGCLYLLNEDSLYSIWVSVATPSPRADQPTIHLKFSDKDFFGTSSEKLELSSRYDSHCFGITSVAIGTVRETFLEIHVSPSEEKGAERASGGIVEKRSLSPSIQIPLRIQPLKGKKFAKWIEETFLVLVTTSLAVIGILAKGTPMTASPAKHYGLFGHDFSSIFFDPLLAVLCLVVPLLAAYVVIKFMLLWNWRSFSAALASFLHKVHQRPFK
jgi:hypothetical protein